MSFCNQYCQCLIEESQNMIVNSKSNFSIPHFVRNCVTMNNVFRANDSGPVAYCSKSQPKRNIFTAEEEELDSAFTHT